MAYKPLTSKYVRPTVMHLCKLMAAIRDLGPVGFGELAEVTGLNCRTVRRYMTEMKRQDLIHIGAWVEDARGHVNVANFSFGPGPDKSRPRRKTSGERTKKCREEARKRAMVTPFQGFQAGVSP